MNFRSGNFDLPLQPAREVYTVSSLNREARRVIEDRLGVVWVEGEISGLARPSSGHLYWRMKDESAQIRCAMFRQRNRMLNFRPDDGQHVLARGRVSIYEPRGEYQLVVEYLEEVGEGLLRRRFEELKRKLAAEGLFDAQRKLEKPELPRRIGVVTSPSGAAVRDIVTVLARRFPAIPVLIYPTAVQGAGAAAEIASALELADRRSECDLLILARGGGSLEDLWSFNEEVVARAMAAVSIPIISGVGHEIDFTIADFVADIRAPTPSGAAELAVPDQTQWLAGSRPWASVCSGPSDSGWPGLPIGWGHSGTASSKVIPACSCATLPSGWTNWRPASGWCCGSRWRSDGRGFPNRPRGYAGRVPPSGSGVLRSAWDSSVVVWRVLLATRFTDGGNDCRWPGARWSR